MKMTDQDKATMLRVSAPIDEAIMMCDSREEFLMLASMMQVSLKALYDTHIGIPGRREMFILAAQSE